MLPTSALPPLGIPFLRPPPGNIGVHGGGELASHALGNGGGPFNAGHPLMVLGECCPQGRCWGLQYKPTKWGRGQFPPPPLSPPPTGALKPHPDQGTRLLCWLDFGPKSGGDVSWADDGIWTPLPPILPARGGGAGWGHFQPVQSGGGSGLTLPLFCSPHSTRPPPHFPVLAGTTQGVGLLIPPSPLPPSLPRILLVPLATFTSAMPSLLAPEGGGSTMGRGGGED